MKAIEVNKLEAGQRYSQPVYIDKESLFVPEGIPIKERDIERLRKWNISEVYSEGEAISEDPQTALNAFFLQAFKSPDQKAVISIYGSLQDELLELFGGMRGNNQVEQDHINNIVDRLIKLVEEHGAKIIQYILYGMQGDTGEIENALNGTILSALVGKKLQLSRHRVMMLCTAAILRDSGMLRISPEIINKKGKLSVDEKRQMQTHPVHSYRIIIKELGYNDEIGITALQHHERWDGQGYPRRIARDQIRMEARIIAVADSFIAMVSNKPYRSSMIGYTAMRNLLSDNGTRFDPEVLKAFIQVLGIYPIGSIVLLSDSTVCRVIENRSSAPLKPRVKTIIDAQGHEFIDDNGPEVDLATAKNVFIAKAVDANSLARQHKGT